MIAPTLRPHYDALRALTDGNTVLVGTLWAFSARFMQELHGTPYVSVQVSPSTLLSAHAPTHPRLTIPARWPLPVKAALMTLIERQVLDRAWPALNAVRRAQLAPARRVLGRWLHSTDGVLCLFPGWFAPPQPDWPSNHLQSGFPLFNDIATPKTMWHSMRISRPVNPGRVHGRFDTRRSRGIRARWRRCARPARAGSADAARCGAGQ